MAKCQVERDTELPIMSPVFSGLKIEYCLENFPDSVILSKITHYTLEV